MIIYLVDMHRHCTGCELGAEDSVLFEFVLAFIFIACMERRQFIEVLLVCFVLVFRQVARGPGCRHLVLPFSRHRLASEVWEALDRKRRMLGAGSPRLEMDQIAVLSIVLTTIWK